MRRLNLKNTSNTRDLGGYPTVTGRYTHYGRFLRSDLPDFLLDEELEILRALGITTIIDLRSRAEAESHACFLSGVQGFEYYSCPMSSDGVFPSTEDDVPRSYFDMLANTENICRIMKLLADAPRGAMFHCTAGKDRTGVIASMLLTHTGVPFPDVVADYQVSETYIQNRLRLLQEIDPTIPAWLGHSRPEYLSAFYDIFRAEFPTVNDYFNHIGLSREDIGKIEYKLLSE